MTHQTNYLHIEFFTLRTWFIWSILWKTKEDSHRPKYTTSFKPSKVATPKISTFSPLCMLLLQFVWIIFFILGDRKQFFVKVYLYPEVLFNCRVLAVFETSELKEFRILYFISRITEQCSWQNEPLLYHEALIHLLNFLHYFQFFFINEMFLWKHVFSIAIFMYFQRV